MPPLTGQELRHITRATRHEPLTIEKVVRLLDILQAIADDGFLSSRLALKGGRASMAFTSTGRGSLWTSTSTMSAILMRW